MNSTLSIKCTPYINGSKCNIIHGIFCLTRRFKSDNDNNSKKNQIAVEKLNNLLKIMKKGNDTNELPQQSRPIELAQPRQLARKVEQNKQEIDESKQNKPLGEKLSDAATKVAQSIGGDTNKTKSDLLNLLKIYNNEPNDSSEKKVKSSVQLDDLLSGMKIDRSQPKDVSLKFSNVDKAQRVKELLGHSSSDYQRTKKYKKQMDNYVPISLFSSEPIGIFKDFNINKDIPILPTWDRLYKKSLLTAVTHPPKNIYEHMIIWTQQGKLWKFPINNEQGMDDENHVFFAEHVFLEPLIDEWCPKQGPIRHFMELVCVGLSKNPFLSVEEKKDHINWFRQYFYTKNQLLNEIGAFEIKSLPENVKEYYKPVIPDE